MARPEACPECNADLRGSPIPQEYIDKGYYGEPTTEPRFYSRMIGHDIRGVYDGVLFWSCPDCGHAWHRFPDDAFNKYYHDKARPYVDAANAGRKAK